MVDINKVRENPDYFKKATADKQLDSKLVDELLTIDETRRELIQKVNDLRAEKNNAAKTQDRELGKQIKTELKNHEPALREIEEKFETALKQIPNPAKDDVKVGKSDKENEVIRTWGTPRKFEFAAKDHLEIGENLGIINVQKASEVSGARFAYMLGDAVKLELALVNYAMNKLTQVGFKPAIPPVLIKKETMEKMGYLEHGGEEDMFVLNKDDLVLVGTSEQSIGPLHANEVVNAKDLPLRYVGYTPCFRREAGSYGKDTRGIIRLHQFDKVEMFSFTHPDNSDDEHEYLLKLEEELFQELEIPYQVVKMVTGDLGAPAARKYDIEAWIPTQEKFREVTSTSTTTDFQSRRLNTKFQHKGESDYVHMLNGTAFAIGRTIVAILEHYQNEDGSVTIPKALQEFMGKDKISAS